MQHYVWYRGLAVTRWSRSTYSYSTSRPVSTRLCYRLINYLSM